MSQEGAVEMIKRMHKRAENGGWKAFDGRGQMVFNDDDDSSSNDNSNNN